MCSYCDDPSRDYLAEVVLPSIARNGVMVQAVGGEGPRAPFAYTVGLTALGRQELVVTGLAATAAATLLNRVAARSDLKPGEVFDLDGRDVEVVHVPNPDAHLFVAHDLYGEQLRALQLVWQDERGHFPWCQEHRGGRGGQPVLGPRTGQS